MNIGFLEIGVCGLSCRLCPSYHRDTKSRCSGCKTEGRMDAGCSFITCAIKKRGVEFCWECPESASCDKWKKHREFGTTHDTFTCYQKLESNIAFIQANGVDRFDNAQKIREKLLVKMLQEFNEGRSKTYYCIAATVLEIGDLEESLARAQSESEGMNIKDRSRVLHAALDAVALQKGYCLKLRR